MYCASLRYRTKPPAIVVREGAPLEILALRDRTRSDIEVIVVEGAGKTGLWEDSASLAGMHFHRELRKIL